MSIYANGAIVSKDYFVSHNGTLGASGERIKTNIVDADDTECLDVLRQLKPKKYGYKDTVNEVKNPCGIRGPRGRECSSTRYPIETRSHPKHL